MSLLDYNIKGFSNGLNKPPPKYLLDQPFGQITVTWYAKGFQQRKTEALCNLKLILVWPKAIYKKLC